MGKAVVGFFEKGSRWAYRNAYAEGFAELTQRFECGFIQSCVLAPASNTIQRSVLESTQILPVCAIGPSMLDNFLFDPAFYTFKALAHPSKPACWLKPLRLGLDQIYFASKQRSRDRAFCFQEPAEPPRFQDDSKRLILASLR